MLSLLEDKIMLPAKLTDVDVVTFYLLFKVLVCYTNEINVGKHQ